jgi:hypothetical protein
VAQQYCNAKAEASAGSGRGGRALASLSSRHQHSTQPRRIHDVCVSAAILLSPNAAKNMPKRLV